jgi:hypothetical protein
VNLSDSLNKESDLKFPLEKYLSASSDREEHQILERYSQQLHSIHKSRKSTIIDGSEKGKKSFVLSPT